MMNRYHEIYEDPPDLAQYSARADLPMEYWPGEWKNKYDVMRATGDPRDWTRFWHRYEAHLEAWYNFCDARRRRKKLYSGWDWNQVMIIGPYGVRKSTLMVMIAKEKNDLGHAVFSNASLLFGWGLSHSGLYTAMGFLPKFSCLAIDESAASLSSRVGHGVAISTYNEMSLNTRKQGAFVMMAGAQDWQVAKSVRAGVREVWRPLDQKSLRLDRKKPLGKALENYATEPINDPANFILAWDVWPDFPYQRNDLIDGDDDQQGFGPPAYTLVAEGEPVRNAFLLNDSFQLAHAGSATLTSSDDVKDDLEKFYERIAFMGGEEKTSGPDPKQAMEELVLTELLAMRAQGWADKLISPGDVAYRLDMDSRKVGAALRQIIPTDHVTKVARGYNTGQLFGWLDKMEKMANAQ